MSHLGLRRIFATLLKQTKNHKVKKFLVLGILFLLPITAYVFFASGVNNFAKLPVLTSSVIAPVDFRTSEGDTVTFKDKITVLGFLGEDVIGNQAYAFNLAHKIYKKNHEFYDFQFLFLLPEGTEEDARALDEKLKRIADTEHWIFAFGTSEALERLFKSLNTDYVLDEKGATPYVFILDKEGNLRGRNDDEDVGNLYGFDARNVAEITNKMMDDVDVILAEYRRALKSNDKYKAERKDEFRDNNLK